MSVDLQDPGYVRTIEWEMMDKTKFFPLSMLSSFSVRCSLYPLTLIKTRLQVQKHDSMYTGLIDAGCKIYKKEGFSGLYRGFWVSSVQIVSGVAYIATYESSRHFLKQHDVSPTVRALISGAVASLVGQTIIVPFDVISQHLMFLGIADYRDGGKVVLSSLGLTIDPTRSKFRTTIDIAQIIYQTDGLKGFYRGYFASVCTYVPNSALWWSFYQLYQDELAKLFPSNFSHLLIQCIAGTLGGFTTTFITNPMDTIRARLQVQRTNSILKTFRCLWLEEGIWMFSKGLSARLVQSVCFSFSIILGYETIKRVSVRQEFKDRVKWI
ncbi:solute carrier family 25 member 44 [Halyomorpha halys]|uniref:solute carrier family 25 member 44 n=1 Tax=Halyomorpha halys TaxID=286706 RepID=UPI0006D4FEC9|nr:solute carrier family 25 member 44-like [Halyomorpha halys]XP_014285647.1 solute carrier family 25 member 44-like [Halyomorpha halys]XP_014285648.1 solute carrier family 25 member 44-like [Halyomorpha halys]XP_014285777.1 solute carrier family 25 member 44-like [Halyomorpha halys]